MKKTFRLIRLSISTICLLLSPILNSQNFKRIDSLLSLKYSKDAPGAVFLISKHGKIVYEKAFGLSNLELDTPMKTNSVFEIGSMTKQFTAVSILLLVEQGKISLKDEITKFIPNYPTSGHKITIHHLLTHTSGIKSLHKIALKDLSPNKLIDFFKDESMDFAPGEKFKYNNSGYIILGYIIEKVSGLNYANFVREYIFKKLHMNSSYYANQKQIIPQRASGYHFRKNYINRRPISYTIPYSSGSLMSTVADMNLWQIAIKNYILISKQTAQLAFKNYTLNNGKHINYGYGWHIKTTNTIKRIEHGGSIFGFKSMGIYLPENDIYVIGLTNCDCNSPTKISKEIAAIASENY
ncbi:CubicO group peptidase, beta-lactamase class C family [Tenacibaculum sp. MAR_2009_124]|uniref:serine hydrolase domain-containing protein n=1 Tax=Tenacibaculum sp. MAR_2009_124 TaxID=1250059 RepID=UPI00089AD00C|nr:serine hydrolase domain-containing protein [Tenacibaculum sp. MAR_2009_124]SEC19057.1 CubicO group peptidase, beta-lactamase class C family [Tenacibaculum sp. MAR_2009_124]